MCKIFTMTNASLVNDINGLLALARDALCAANDRDGFGYSISGKGHLFTEKTVNPFDLVPGTNQSRSKTNRLPIVYQNTVQSGLMPKKPQYLIAHGRMSTNTVSLDNTHPFVSDDNQISLIHNGVVNDEGNIKVRTDCDSEIMLRYFEAGGIPAIEQNVTGYYALAIIDQTTGILHIVRDDRATLYIAWSDTVQSYLIATTKEIILRIAKGQGWVIEAPELIVSNTHTQFTGNSVVWESITPRICEALDSKASLAFGERADPYSDFGDIGDICESCRFDYSDCICDDCLELTFDANDVSRAG